MIKRWPQRNGTMCPRKSKTKDVYFHEMEKKWAILSYCDNHWKANAIVTLHYSQWYRTYSRNRKLKHNGQSNDGPTVKKHRTTTKGPCNTPSPPLGLWIEIVPTPVPKTPFKGNDVTKPPVPQVKEQGPSQHTTSRPSVRPLMNPL
jgi:hypothetical protein